MASEIAEVIIAKYDSLLHGGAALGEEIVDAELAEVRETLDDAETYIYTNSEIGDAGRELASRIRQLLARLEVKGREK